MKLYMNLVSPNVRRVRLTAAVLGTVPTLVDGDFVLTESRAIMQYLASDVPVSEFPNVEAFFSRMSAMDAWKQTSP